MNLGIAEVFLNIKEIEIFVSEKIDVVIGFKVAACQNKKPERKFPPWLK